MSISVSRLRPLLLPAGIAMILIVATGWYNLYWLPYEHRQLDDRKFRLLKTMGEQIGRMVDNYDNILDNAATFGEELKPDSLDHYLSMIDAKLRVWGPKLPEGCQDLFHDFHDFSDPPYMKIQSDEGTQYLCLGLSHRRPNNKDSLYIARADLHHALAPLISAAYREAFDSLFVVQSDGSVIFEDSQSGLSLTRIESLEDQAKTLKATDKGPQRLAFNSVGAGSMFLPVTLAGANYRLYSQPIQLSFPVVGGKKDEPERWAVCGLVRADHFQSASRELSYTYILWAFAAFFLIFISAPFLRLWLAGASERRRSRTVAQLAVFAYLGAAGLSLTLVDIYHWAHAFDCQTRVQMRTIACDIQRKFQLESRAIWRQIDEFEASKSFQQTRREVERSRGELPTIRSRPSGANLTSDNEKLICRPARACRSSLLNSDDPRPEAMPQSYPYLDFVSWINAAGRQQVKWSVRSQPTQFVDLSKLRSPVYPDIQKKFAERKEDAAHPTRAPFYRDIACLLSPNTGQNITVFWELMDGDPPARGTNQLACSLLTAWPVSLMHPVLPGGFHFAVVDRLGTVLFHSDDARNLHENFFEECNNDRALKALVAARASSYLTAYYAGQQHRLYVTPMAVSCEAHSGTVGTAADLWTIVVLRNLRLEQQMHLEALIIASLLFLLYSAALGLTWFGVHCWLRRRADAAHVCLWPDALRERTYWWLTATHAAGIAALIGITQVFGPRTGVLAAFCVVFFPFLAVLVTRLVPPADTEKGSSWPRSYALAGTTMLLLVAAVPAAVFFNAAYNCERLLVIKRSQLQLPSQIAAREAWKRKMYQRVEMTSDMQRVILAPANHGCYDPYYLSVLRPDVPCAQQNDSKLPCSPTPSASSSTPPQFEPCQGLPPDSVLKVVAGLSLSPLKESRYAARNESPVFDWGCSRRQADGSYILELRKSRIPGADELSQATWKAQGLPLRSLRWWLGALGLFGALFWLIRASTTTIFRLHLPIPDEFDPMGLPADFDDPDWLERLRAHVLVIGPALSPAMTTLINSADARCYDMEQVVAELSEEPMAATVGGRPVTPRPRSGFSYSAAREAQRVVFGNVQSATDDPRRDTKKLALLENLVYGVGTPVMLLASSNLFEMNRQQEEARWRQLAAHFIPLDLRVSVDPLPLRKNDFDKQVLAKAYCHWRFEACSEAEKLALVQLSQEGLVNGDATTLASLMKKQLVTFSRGRLCISSECFSNYVRAVWPAEHVRQLETHGPGLHWGRIRASLVLIGIAIPVFLFYTQTEVFTTWIAYVTGIAAALPSLMQLFGVSQKPPQVGAQTKT